MTEDAALENDALAPALLALLDGLSATMFCAKDSRGRYVAVNPTFVRRAGETSRRAVLGRRAEDLFVPDLAQRYTEQDRRVLAGAELRHELELIRSLAGQPRWHLTTKLPVRSGDAVVGLVSLSQDVDDARDTASFPLLAQVLERLDDETSPAPTPAELATLAGTTPAVLSRRIRRLTGLSTSQLVLRSRIDRAAHLLTTTTTPLAEVAALTGFYDQAAFSRQFARLSGETPAQFRRRAARRPAPSAAASALPS
ncbi:AraC family transcriptional regulator [Serinibacter arcticus]|uniref:AraC family transcriptional regulator n=1 Tax=Serinibacter arcticus TaxID=1655435 RepID=A0A2U1ZTG1_9MICO|nr:AraC family transcriptional regulator [Serinibacter arcticus]PWD50275.1 AraC family transcriptional regulator [Serinibacter arcticus]